MIPEILRKSEKISLTGFSGNDNEFSLDGRVILKISKVIPSILRDRVMNELHRAHTGIVRIKALSRS